MCEVDSSGNVTAVNTVGATGVLARHVNGTGGGSVFYAFDPQGSVSLRLDTSGNVLSSHVNEAWGTQVSAGSGYASDPYAGYGGQWGYYRDVETGLHLLGHRYYDAARGRFINRDPIGYEGGINLYAYSRNGSVDHIDPSGFNTHQGDQKRRGKVYNYSSDPITVCFDFDKDGKRYVGMMPIPPGYVTNNDDDDGVDIDFVPGWGSQWIHIPGELWGFGSTLYFDGPGGSCIQRVGAGLPFKGPIDKSPPEMGGQDNGGGDPVIHVPPSTGIGNGWIRPIPFPKGITGPGYGSGTSHPDPNQPSGKIYD